MKDEDKRLSKKDLAVLMFWLPHGRLFRIENKK